MSEVTARQRCPTGARSGVNATAKFQAGLGVDRETPIKPSFDREIRHRAARAGVRSRLAVVTLLQRIVGRSYVYFMYLGRDLFTM